MIACAKRTTFFAPVFACAGPSVTSTSTWCGSRNWPTPRTTSTLRAFAMPARPPVSLPTTLSFERAQLVEVDLRRAERDAVLGERLRLVHDGRDVQQRLRRNAADVEAHAAERRVALDQHRLHAEVGGAERRGVAARARRRAPASRIRRRPCRCRSRRRDRRGAARLGAARSPALRAGGCRARRRRGGRGLRRRRPRRASSTTISEPSLTLSPSLTLTSLTVPAAATGTSIVALSDSSVTSESSAFDRIARLHEDLDDRDVLEVADVGDLDFDRAHGRIGAAHSITRRMSASTRRGRR